MSSFIDSGAGIALSIWFVLALVLNSENILLMGSQRFGCGVVWCSYNERTNSLGVYSLLINHLHGKAAELYLANSGNNRVTTTKYMSTIIASCTHYSLHYSFYHVVLVKFYCDVQ